MLANHAPALNDSPQGDSDYETILTALMDTARGRWFLQEYLLRNRSAETATLLSALGRIEHLLQAKSLEPAGPVPEVTMPAPDAMDGGAMIPEAMVISVAGAETTAVEVARIEAVAGNAAEMDSVTVEVAEVQQTAIEFLGPHPTDTANPVGNPPLLDRVKDDPRDPFADFRALSNEEKIALFT